MQNALVSPSRWRCRAAAAGVLVGLATGGQPEARAHALYKCIDKGVTIYSDAPCVSTTGPSGASAERLTQPQVLALVQAVDRAAARMDWESRVAFLADDAVIDIRIRSSRNRGQATISKAEYRRLINEVRDKISSYALRREDVQVTIHPDGYRAEVESKLTERWQDPGGAMMATSRERWLVEVRGGRPRITALDAVMSEPQPQPSR
jgi:hypothetical protein